MSATELTIEELTAALKEAREAQALVQQATARRYAEIGEPVLAALVKENDLTYSKSSAWVGISQNGMPFVVDGVAYTASVTITHTAENTRRKPIFAEAKKFADDNKLTGEKRKEFLAKVMEASENPAPVEA